MKIVVTGASGLVGRHLLPLLRNRGFEVYALSTNKKLSQSGPGIFYWDPANDYIDAGALHNAYGIIHLAGCGIADHKWTASYKQEIIDSRVQTAGLLLKHVQEENIPLKKFVSAGGIGYYPDPSKDLLSEDAESGDTFLADVCRKWEKAAHAFEDAGIKTAVLRTGIVLARDGGFLQAVLKTAKIGVIPTTGQRSNLLSWIDIDDLCRAYAFCLQPEVTGVFNAVSPYPVTQIEMVRTAADALGKRYAWHPDVPNVFLRMAMGERAVLAQTDQNISGEKLARSGFKFLYPQIRMSLNHLLGHGE
jgi:uncharacterized protein (TIGR01777 family)